MKGGAGHTLFNLRVFNINYILNVRGENGEYDRFEQEVHEKDYWQTDFVDEESKYSLSFNIPTSEASPTRAWKLELFVFFV